MTSDLLVNTNMALVVSREKAYQYLTMTLRSEDPYEMTVERHL